MLNVIYKSIESIQSTKSARVHSSMQIEQISRSIETFGFNNPILIDENNHVIAGNGRLHAARQLGILTVPTVILAHLSKAQLRAYMLADNKLAEKAKWDAEILKIELQNLLDLEFDLTLTGFDTPEIDLYLHGQLPFAEENLLDDDNFHIPKKVSTGELWQLGRHKLYCGDSLDSESFRILLGEEKASLIFTDPPYNVSIENHAGGKGKIKHTEFAYASGEMSKADFINFLQCAFRNMKEYSTAGSIHFICMDWRHIEEIMSAGRKIYSELKNICVWNKQLAGMGSLYRSQHEFVFVFKNGKESHVNNIELGKHGRNRTNVWDYEGVHISSHHRNELKLHPTVKPVQMIADAIADCSKQGHIILDCFAGSGSTLLAAEIMKRKARVIEYEPKYCDVIIDRFEKMTNIKAQKLSGGINERL